MVPGTNQLLMPCRLSVVPTNDAVMAVTSSPVQPSTSGRRRNDRLRNRGEMINGEVETVQLKPTCVACYSCGKKRIRSRRDYEKGASIKGEDR